MKSLINKIVVWSFLASPTFANEILDAEKAVKAGASLEEFAHLQPHPLYPYLQFQHFLKHLDDIQGISQFLQQNSDAAFAPTLAAAAYEQWKNTDPHAILKSYNPQFGTPKVNCFYAQVIPANQRENLKLAPNCAHLFSVQQLREAFREALRNKKNPRQFIQFLPSEEEVAAKQFLNGDIPTLKFWKSLAFAEKIANFAAKEPEKAVFYARDGNVSEFEDFEYAYNRLVRKLARIDSEQTYSIWLQMPPKSQQMDTILDIIAYALRRHDWAKLDFLLSHLDPETKSRAEIQYWLGSFAERNHQPHRAKKFFQHAAQQRDFFGFLAAEKLGLPLTMTYKQIKPKPHIQEIIGNAAQRAMIWQNLGENQRALQEWEALLRTRTPEEMEQMALFAHQNGWHIQAITTLAKSKSWDALEVRFPIQYRDEIFNLARQHGIKPSEILAIIRKESIFQPQVKSPAGALGLMQIMPATADETARRYGIPYAGKHELIANTSINLMIGSQYLADRLNEFGGLAYAAAAYNAGPRRVTEWKEKFPGLPLDEWIAQIPFTETRDYVKKVMEYEKIYEYLLQK